MKTRGQSSGFTIIELIVVIIMIALLATLVGLSYGNAQAQARDTQIRDAADKFADAIKLMESKNNGQLPSGGSGSTTAVSATTGCSNGSSGFQGYKYAAKSSSYACTLGDAAVAQGYLNADLFTGLPINNKTGSNLDVFMVYSCSGKNYLFYTLEIPIKEEQSAYSAASGLCDPGTQTTLAANGMAAVEDLGNF